MHIFYDPFLEKSTEFHFLSEEESNHCIKVLRLQVGDKINLVDGRGGFYDAEIVTSNPKRTELKILNLRAAFGKRNHHLHIAVAPTKNIERTEWFLEKATEIGIDEITPVLCDFSERKEIKIERLNKVIASAIKQSIKAYLPRLNEIQRFKAIIEMPFNGQKFIAHCAATPKHELKEILKPNGSYLILIGPEGDFSPTEIDKSAEHGFVPISLGLSRLRTETAALQACFEVNFLNR